MYAAIDQEKKRKEKKRKSILWDSLQNPARELTK